MVKKNLISLSIILVSTTMVLAQDNSLINCKISKITIPLLENDGKLLCAASFSYGQYAKNPMSANDMFTGENLIGKFNVLPEEERLKYPEYIIMRQCKMWRKLSEKDFLGDWEPGYSRDQGKGMYTNLERKDPFETFTELYFLDKSVLGPYIRITFGQREPTSADGKKGRGFAGPAYFKYVDDRYFRVSETLSLLDDIVSYYGGKTILGREHITLDPNTANMKCIVFDVDPASTPDNKKYQTAILSKDNMELPDTFSQNCLYLYLNLEPINIQFTAGKQLADLSPEMRFYESSVTKQEFGSEDEILACWSGKSQDYLLKDIERLKSNKEWPLTRSRPLGHDPLIIASMRTSKGTVLFFKSKRSSWIRTVGLLVDKDGKYSFSGVRSMRDLSARYIFDHVLFIKAVGELYLQ